MDKPAAGKPYTLHAGEGWTYAWGPEFVIKAGESGRRLAVAHMTTRAGEEPADHTHATEDEIFYLLSGSMTFRCGDETFELERDGFIFLPRGIQHGYTIRSADDVRVLILTSPADGTVAGGWGGIVSELEIEG